MAPRPVGRDDLLVEREQRAAAGCQVDEHLAAAAVASHQAGCLERSHVVRRRARYRPQGFREPSDADRAVERAQDLSARSAQQVLEAGGGRLVHTQPRHRRDRVADPAHGRPGNVDDRAGAAGHKRHEHQPGLEAGSSGPWGSGCSGSPSARRRPSPLRADRPGAPAARQAPWRLRSARPRGRAPLGLAPDRTEALPGTEQRTDVAPEPAARIALQLTPSRVARRGTAYLGLGEELVVRGGDHPLHGGLERLAGRVSETEQRVGYEGATGCREGREELVVALAKPSSDRAAPRDGRAVAPRSDGVDESAVQRRQRRDRDSERPSAHLLALDVFRTGHVRRFLRSFGTRL